MLSFMTLGSTFTFSFRSEDDSASYIKKPMNIILRLIVAADAERV